MKKNKIIIFGLFVTIFYCAYLYCTYFMLYPPFIIMWPLTFIFNLVLLFLVKIFEKYEKIFRIKKYIKLNFFIFLILVIAWLPIFRYLEIKTEQKGETIIKEIENYKEEFGYYPKEIIFNAKSKKTTPNTLIIPINKKTFTLCSFYYHINDNEYSFNFPSIMGNYADWINEKKYWVYHD